MRKSLFVLPIVIGSFLVCSSESVSRYLAGGTVFVIYDAGEGLFAEGDQMIGCRVRLGAQWGKLYPSEKPSSNPKPSDYPQREFECWILNGQPVDPNVRISSDCIVKASYVAKASTGDFEGDSWAVLSREAEQGLEHLKEVYSEYLSEKGVTTFVGLTKNIIFNGLTYQARIIGENHDILSSDHSKTAALTFELTNAITDIPFAMTDSNNYRSSLLREKLNDEILQLFEPGARDGFKSVVKLTNVGGGTSSKPSTKIEETNDKLFPLSLSEMDGEKYIEHFTLTRTSPRYKFYYHQWDGEQWIGNIENEGDAYDYYKVQAEDYKDLSKSALGKTDKIPYWVRSPDVELPAWVWVIDDQGFIGEYSGDTFMEQQGREVWDSSVAVAPCFAIGGSV